MPKNEWIIEDDLGPAQAIKPTFGQELKGIPVQAARGAEDFVNFLGNLFGEPSMPGYQPKVDLETPEFRGLSSAVQSGLNVPEEALSPENLLTSGLQRFARGGLPAATLGGVLGGIPGALQALTTTGVGSGVATGAKALGAPEEIQDLAQFASEIGYGVKKGNLPTIRKAQKIEDQLTRGAAKSGTRASAEDISKALSEVTNKLATEVSEKSSKKIRHALETVSNNMFKGNINPVDAIDLRKKLYKLTKELPSHVAVDYIEPLTKGINNFFATYAAENPIFYKHLTARDKLTQIKNMEPIISKAIDTLKLKEIPVAGPIASVLKKALGGGERFIRGLATNSAARKVYFNIVKGAAQNDPALMLRYANQFVRIMPESKEEPKSEWIIED